MGIFSSIMDKVFHRKKPEAAPAAPAPAPAPAAAPVAAAPPPPPEPVNVEAVLVQIAAQKGGGGNWRTSIVDLLKLLDLDSSLAARKELADELNYTGDKNDSAKMNVWLHKALMKALAENGGKVPDELKT